MVINKLASFKSEKSSLFRDENSIFKSEKLIFTTKFFALEGTLISKEFILLNQNIAFEDSEILVLSEPIETNITKEKLCIFKEKYRNLVIEAQNKNLPIIHIITNSMWTSLFEDIIKDYNIRVLVTPENNKKTNIPLENIFNVNQFFLLSHFYNYSNVINDKILIDLTVAPDILYHYKLNLNQLLKSVNEFTNIDILINDSSYVPQFKDEKIKVYKSSDYDVSRFKENTYVYLYSNSPYSVKDVNKVIFYAANSKIVYTNYNFYINNLLPSVVMNLNKNGYSINILPKKEAFDILNENRNTILYNNTILNVLNEVSNIYLDKPAIESFKLNKVLPNFVDDIYMTQDSIKGSIEIIAKNYKYDLEKTLLFPIVFLGKDRSVLDESSAQSNGGSEKQIIPTYNNQKILSIEGTKTVSMIVPIHNNGRYLKYKCFNSILKLTCFESIEIIFVDDGSTDEETLRIIDDIIYNYPNVVYKRFENGSGSASRPRNIGMTLAKGKYITFLDPDNEAINDGYSTLLNELTLDNSLDMVIGDIVREDNIKRNDISYFKKVTKVQQSAYIENTRDTLVETNLAVQSIQALIVKKEIVDKNNLTMIEGAAGQDTLFFQELLLKCNKVKVINQNVHSYYAYVEGSVTNTVSSKFFEKFYRVEIERIKFLEAENLIDFYMEIRFNNYLNNWYFKKYQQVIGKEERQKAYSIIVKILKLYKQYEEYYDNSINEFMVENKPSNESDLY